MKKLLKKVIAPMIAVSMLLALSATTVLAVPSGEDPVIPDPPVTGGSAEDPTIPDAGAVGGGSFIIDGTVHNIVLGQISAEAKAAVNSTDKIINLLGSKYVRGMDVKVLGMADASLPAGIQMPPNGIRLSFNVSGVKKGDIVKILHQKHDGTWEALDTTTGEGTVSAVFTELSPVIFTKLTATTTGNDGKNTVVDPSKSPKTGR